LTILPERLINFKLTGITITAAELTQLHIDRCFELFNLYYENVSYDRFIGDLMEKKWVILLWDKHCRIQGFSTQMLVELRVDDKVTCKGIFSGDTIIHRDYWGDLELAKIWGRFVFTLQNEYPDLEFWFLISKGYKTYKFLPTYFRRFYPCYNLETPEFEKKLIDAFGLMKFPGNYNPDKGVIQMNGTKDYLKPNIADITEKRLKDPHIAFFAKKNPGYYKGNELVCIAKISQENMQPIVHRYFLKGQFLK
jgi:hypothetical protein